MTMLVIYGKWYLEMFKFDDSDNFLISINV